MQLTSDRPELFTSSAVCRSQADRQRERLGGGCGSHLWLTPCPGHGDLLKTIGIASQGSARALGVILYVVLRVVVHVIVVVRRGLSGLAKIVGVEDGLATVGLKVVGWRSDSGTLGGPALEIVEPTASALLRVRTTHDQAEVGLAQAPA